MNAKRLRGALFSRARAGSCCLVGSIVVFTGGLWLATAVYIDSGPLCMFLCVIPVSLLMVYLAYMLDEADHRYQGIVQVSRDDNLE